MRGFGFTMITLGLFGLLLALGMDTSVSNGLSGRVENIGLLSRQSNGLIVSGLLFMTGCILVGLAAVRDAVNRLGPMIVANAPHAMPPAQQRSVPPGPDRSPVGGGARPSASLVDATKTCPKCYALLAADTVKCMRCGAEFQAQPAKGGNLLVGSRVHHQSFGEGEIEAIDGDTATVRFDRREKPEPMNMAYLTLGERVAP